MKISIASKDVQERGTCPVTKSLPWPEVFVRMMLKKEKPLILLILSLCIFSCTPDETVNSAASEVEAREIAFAKTMEDRDLHAFLGFISPEAVFFNGNIPLRGFDAITQAWAPLFKDEKAPFSWQPDVIEVLESGLLALSSGPIRSASGEILGRFNSVWRKDKDGQWRVIFDKGS